jgi:hypothetical protein
MEGHEDQAHRIKRMVLPGGKTIEVVYFSQSEVEPSAAGQPHAEPAQDLHVCIECSCELVYPVQWEEAGPENWTVLLHCPNCGVYREGVFTQETVEAFDEELDRGAEALEADYTRLVHTNMTDEAERFTGALAAGAILPEDF